MEVNYGNVLNFAGKNGNVCIRDSRGTARVLKSGERDGIDLVQKADHFLFNGKWYTRDEFATLLDGESRQKDP